MRRRRQVSQLKSSVHVPLQGHVDSSFAAHMLGVVAKFVLLNRNQIPAGLEELAMRVQQVEADAAKGVGTRRRLPRAVKHAQQLLQSFSQVMEALEAAFRHPSPSSAAILLGPTTAQPKEAYIVRFKPAATACAAPSSAAHPAATQQPTEHAQAAGKRLTRSLLSLCPSIPAWNSNSMPGPTKLHFLFQQPHSSPAPEGAAAVQPQQQATHVVFHPKPHLSKTIPSKVPLVIDITLGQQAHLQHGAAGGGGSSSSTSDEEKPHTAGGAPSCQVDTLSAATASLSLYSQHCAQQLSSCRPQPLPLPDTATSGHPSPAPREHTLLLHHHCPKPTAHNPASHCHQVRPKHEQQVLVPEAGGDGACAGAAPGLDAAEDDDQGMVWWQCSLSLRGMRVQPQCM